jgi:hypothetical protein
MNKKGETLNFDVVYFDTNIFIDVATGEITLEEWRSMIKLTDAKRIRRFFSVVNLIELGSELETMGQRDFRTFQNPFNVIKECCGNNILPDPESVMSAYFDKRTPQGQNDLCAYVDLVLTAPDYDTLVNGQTFVMSDGREFRFAVKSDFLAQFRNTYQRYYTEGMSQVVAEINPDYAIGLTDSSRVRDEARRNALNKMFESDDFKEIILKTLFDRCGIKTIGEIRDDDLLTLKLLDGYVSLYRYILQQTVNCGRKSEKKESDFADLEFLLYLGKGYLFISEDRQFENALVHSSQKDQIMKFDEFIAFLKQGG